MTAIIGFIDEPNRRAYLAGDSSVVSGTALELLDDGKVWTSGEMLIGAAGSLRTLQVARYLFTPPELSTEGFDGLTYMITQFVPRWFKVCADNNELRGDPSGVRKSGGGLLIALRGHLYTVDDHFCVTRATNICVAIGCVREAAEASVLTALKLAALVGWPLQFTRDLDVRRLLETTLHVCSELSTSVCAPFDIIETPY